ncbi:MAG: tetratricopeptide repeat protein [Myxococcales bacterium]|nr:tetratricopeptide repeat protein [Myxococcales bacterium]
MRQNSMRLIPVILLLLSLSVPMSTDAARAARSTQQARKSAASGKAAVAGELSGKSASQTPDKGLAGDITRRKEEKAKDIPALRYDDYTLGVELQVASKRHEQIESLKKIIDLGPSPAEAPELTFRLAELYWEESKYHFFEANRKDDEIFRARAEQNRAALAKAEEEKKQSLGRVTHFQKLAIDQYSSIIRKYAKYERMDEVLFYLAKTMWDAGQEKNSITVYRKLIKDHSTSKFLPDAYVAIGQFYFNGAQGRPDYLSRALLSFEEAARFTDSQVYGYALYMQAWCHFNMSDHAAAAEMFKAVIYLGDIQGAKADARTSSLAREARNDFVRAYSNFGDAFTAKTEFQKVGGAEQWWNMLKALAGLYYVDGKDKEATIVYKIMLNERPLSPEAPFFQGRIVDCIMRVGDKRKTSEQVRELVRITQEVERAGVIVTENDKKEFEAAKELSERTLSNLAVNWHNEAKKTRDENTFLLAADVYQDYLDIFPRAAKSYDMRFYYAELLNDHLNKFDRAAEEYTQVVLMDIARMEPQPDENGEAPEPQKPGKWLENASYNAILAFNVVATQFERTEKLPESDGKNSLPIPAIKQQLLEACLRYIKYVPTGNQRTNVMYMAAQIFYRYNHFERSTPIFAAIALEYPESEVAVPSANLVLDAFNLQEDWAQMNEWARKFYAEPRLAKRDFKAELGKLIEMSSFKLISELEAKQDFVGAANTYLTFVGEFPKSELADQALFNASIDFFKGKQINRSLEVCARLIAEYPKSRFLPQCLYANGETYEMVGDFELAAQSYEAYANAYAKQDAKSSASAASGAKFEQDKAQTGLFNAGVFREGLGQPREALKNRSLYLDLWPNSKDAEALSLSMNELLEKTGQTGKALQRLDDYVKEHSRNPDKVLQGLLKILKIYEKAQRPKDLERTLRLIHDFASKLTHAQRDKLGVQAMEAVARAAYWSIEPEFDAYARISFPEDEKKLKGVMEAKQKALVGAEKRYSEVILMKIAEPAICSLYKIGLLYKNFADQLGNAPIPKMPFPQQLNPIRHLMDRPWDKWPADYKEAIPEADFENIKAQLAEAEEQFKQAYRDQLFEFAMPLEEKAADGFLLAVQESRNLAIYNDCAREALALLAEKYRPSQFPRVTEHLAEIKLEASGTQAGNGLIAHIVAPLTDGAPSTEAIQRAASTTAPGAAPKRPQAAPQAQGRTPAPATPSRSSSPSTTDGDELFEPDEEGLF